MEIVLVSLSFPTARGGRLAVAALVLAFAPPSARADTEAPNVLTEPERRAGWRLLFDGRSTDGFRGYRQESPGPGWVVDDGALVRRGANAGDLVTKETFGCFELQLEFRIAPGGNSGVMFHVTESEPKPWMSGPEVQILDNAAGRDAQRTGWLYQLYEAKPDATRPAGEWNQLSLRVAPDSGQVCINGVRYVTFKKGGPEWDQRVAKSKFALYPNFGRADQGHVCLQDHGDEVAFRSIKVRRLPPTGEPLAVLDDGTVPVRAVPAFPGLEWEGWSPQADDGTAATPLRPLLVTHAGDGSGRVFVLDQAGMIHVVAPAGEPGANRARLFLDLRERTAPWGKENEEGLLGLALHPRFRETGEFFVCYCVRGDSKRTERISRFRMRATDRDGADPASEEVLLSIEQPFPNHNGGSIAFGGDGMLYVGLGDGGGANDPLAAGQDLDTWLGKVLRIDVDRRDPGRAYAVPSDNPFVGHEHARPEIFASGFRNPWQIAFDHETGRLWAADVGQHLTEEIDVVEKGGNYGWSLKEGTSAFGRVAAGAGMIDPVWEYDHGIGKSITGGFVVRGSTVPALEGGYLYGDHVSGRMWALWQQPDGRIENKSVPWNGLPIFGFGRDEAGNVYALTSSATGQGVFRITAE
ncbi:MAG: family 16 glycoside hydrolase [Planctomycetia bacterium]